MAPTTLAPLTTLRLGGPADRVLAVADPADWADTVHAIDQRDEPAPAVLGGGSNVIASDAGHRGTVVVMNTRGITAERADDRTVAVTVQAGHPLADLVTWAAAEHLAGIECLAGIPGTVGAAPVQNAGAYGQQVSDTLHHVTAWDWQDGTLQVLPARSCHLRYRQSLFKARPGRWTILTATFHLTRTARAAAVAYRPLADELGVPVGTRPPVAEVTAAVLANRHRRGLLLHPHGPDARQVGSVFLNPPVTSAEAARWSAVGCPVHADSDGHLRASAGWLLEHVGCRPGHRLADGIRCSQRRTLTLTVHDGATAMSLKAVLGKLAQDVHEATGIELATEPVTLGV
ncbi:UDP-N-acetylmuramate dehydrogenase [Kitasatospora griseola]|uniref:UDP-N-acetylmuramate dehydrogenase n=1 Tax=Kitasatospora griseola TaxID=2064 RepID=UPI00381E3C6A